MGAKKEAGVVGQMIRNYIKYRRGFREQRGEPGLWSQAHLARVVGISEKHMCKLVQGAVPLTIDLAKRIEAATDRDLSAKVMLHADIDDKLKD